VIRRYAKFGLAACWVRLGRDVSGPSDRNRYLFDERMPMLRSGDLVVDVFPVRV